MGKLFEIIKDNADGKKLGGLNLKRYAEKKAAHVEACKGLIQAHKDLGLPITILVYLGVSKQAHRLGIAKKGYKSCDIEKIRTIAEWMKMFAEKNGNKSLSTDAVVAHALCHIYDKVSKETDAFVERLNASKPYDKSRYYKVDGILALLGIEREHKVKSKTESNE